MVRKHFGKDELKSCLRNIADVLDGKATAYLIGGCALTFREMKESTKDVDIIFDNKRSLVRFKKALSEAGFKTAEEITDEYEMMECAGIFERKDGLRFDLFYKKVLNKIKLTESMKKRASHFGSFGGINLLIMSNEDILLSKGLGTRKGDIEDMAVVWSRGGINWDIIKKELISQKNGQINEIFLWSIRRLKEKNFTCPLLSWLEKQ